MSVSPAMTWTDIASSGPTTTTHTVDGLTEGTQYTFEVRAVNGEGDGDEASVTATAADTTAPTFVSQAWLARFGRTVASDVIDGITDRLANPRGGSEVRIAGMTLQHDGSTWTEAPVEDAEHGRRLELGHERTVAEREISAHEVLTQSAFRLQGRSDAPGGAAWGAWGHLSTSSFEGEADGLTLSGDVVTGVLGADIGTEEWTAGVALSSAQG